MIAATQPAMMGHEDVLSSGLEAVLQPRYAALVTGRPRMAIVVVPGVEEDEPPASDFVVDEVIVPRATDLARGDGLLRLGMGLPERVVASRNPSSDARKRKPPR